MRLRQEEDRDPVRVLVNIHISRTRDAAHSPMADYKLSDSAWQGHRGHRCRTYGMSKNRTLYI